MKNPTDVLSGIFVLIICGIGAYSISSLPEPTSLDLYGPASFPKMIIALLAFCGILLIIKGIKTPPSKDYWKNPHVIRHLCYFIGLFYAYLASLTYLGEFFITLQDIYIPSGTAFCITTTLFLLIALPLLGRKKTLENIIVSVTTTACLFGVFGVFFKVLLP